MPNLVLRQSSNEKPLNLTPSSIITTLNFDTEGSMLTDTCLIICFSISSTALWKLLRAIQWLRHDYLMTGWIVLHVKIYTTPNPNIVTMLRVQSELKYRFGLYVCVKNQPDLHALFNVAGPKAVTWTPYNHSLTTPQPCTFRRTEKSPTFISHGIVKRLKTKSLNFIIKSVYT